MLHMDFSDITLLKIYRCYWVYQYIDFQFKFNNIQITTNNKLVLKPYQEDKVRIIM